MGAHPDQNNTNPSINTTQVDRPRLERKQVTFLPVRGFWCGRDSEVRGWDCRWPSGELAPWSQGTQRMVSQWTWGNTFPLARYQTHVHTHTNTHRNTHTHTHIHLQPTAMWEQKAQGFHYSPPVLEMFSLDESVFSWLRAYLYWALSTATYQGIAGPFNCLFSLAVEATE